MPIYEYECKSCGETFEARQKFSDAPLSACTLCGASNVSKLISRTAFSLKGAGWYQQGYGAAKPAACSSSNSDSGGCAGCPKAAANE